MKLGPEDRVQLGILEYLEAVLPHAIVAHIPNGGRRSLSEGKRFKALGVVAGFPDLIILPGQGRAYFLEVKAGRNKPTPEQEAFGEDVRGLGCGWAVVRNLDDVRLALKAWGVATREANTFTGQRSD